MKWEMPQLNPGGNRSVATRMTVRDLLKQLHLLQCFFPWENREDILALNRKWQRKGKIMEMKNNHNIH